MRISKLDSDRWASGGSSLAVGARLVISSKDLYAYQKPYNKGVSLYNKNKYSKAIYYYSKAIELNPYYANAYINRGATYYYLKSYKKAIQDFSNAITLNPTANHYNSLGFKLIEIGQYTKAIKVLKKITTKIDPNFATAYQNLALCYWLRDKNKNKALSFLEIAFKKGYTDIENLVNEKQDGKYLRGLKKTKEFKALIKKYKKK